MSNAVIAVPFHGNTLLATLVNDVPHVALKPICESIGLDWDAQRQRIKRHPILSKGTVIITAPSNGGIQEMLMLPIKMLNGWLFGVDANRVKPEIKDRVIEYQLECFDVLANHFMPKQLPNLKQLPEPPTITKAQQGELFTQVGLIAGGGGDGKLKTKLWSRFKNHFRLNSYGELPADKYEDALTYLGKLKDECNQGADMLFISTVELESRIAEAVKRVEGELVDDMTDSDKIYTQEECEMKIAAAINDVLKNRDCQPTALLLVPIRQGRLLLTVEDYKLVKAEALADNMHIISPAHLWSLIEDDKASYFLVRKEHLQYTDPKHATIETACLRSVEFPPR